MFGRTPKPKKDKGSLDLARRIGNKHFSVVSEFDENGEEHILGHGGSVSLSFGDVVVISNGTETFRSTETTFRAAELMSGNDNNLDKLFVTGSSARAQDLLGEISRAATAAQNNLDVLPASLSAISESLKFVNQAGDYAAALAR